MRQPIDTAPKDGTEVWVESATGAFDIARWSSEAGEWVWRNGGTIDIAPTHWHPITEDVFVEEEQSRGGLSVGRASRIAACLIAMGLVAAALVVGLDGEHEIPDTARAGDSAGLDPAPETASAQQTSLQREAAAIPMQDVTASPQPLLAATAPSRQSPEEETAHVDAAVGELVASTELRQSLQQEREKSAALATELAKSRGDLEATVTLSSKLQDDAVQRWQAAEIAAEELRQSLQQERTRTAALADELTGTRREIETRDVQSRKAGDAAAQDKQAADRETAELRQSLQQEQQKIAALSREVDAGRQAMTASAEQQRSALEEAQRRAAALASELAGTRSEIEREAAQSKKAVDEATRQKQAAEAAVADLRQSLRRQQEKTAALVKEAETARAPAPNAEQAEQQARALDEVRARAAALVDELAGTRREIESRAVELRKANDAATQQKQAAERETAELRQSLRQQQEKTAALVKEAETARAPAPNAEQAEQQARALDEVRTRAAALVDELAGTRREIESRAVELRKANDAATQQKQADEREIAELRSSLQQERNRAEATAQELASARRSIEERTAPVRAIESPVAPVTQTPAAAVSEPATTEQDKAEAARLIARASALLGQGNIGAARTVLERAVANDNARASFMLAETYDPAVLSAWGTHGTRGEAVKARELYAKAHSGGIREAKDRLDALSR